MFNFSFGELLLIGTIALVVLGPDKLPGAARTAGMWVGKIKRMVSDLQNEVTAQFEAEELRRELKETQSKVDMGLSRLRQRIDKADTSLRQGVERADSEVRRSLGENVAGPATSASVPPGTPAPRAPAIPPAPPEVRDAPPPPPAGRRPIIALAPLNEPLEALSGKPSTATDTSANAQDHSHV